jgi:hypothetical protein
LQGFFDFFLIFFSLVAIALFLCYNKNKYGFKEISMNFDKLKEALDHIHTDNMTPAVDCMVYLDHQPIFRYMRGVRNIETSGISPFR